MSFQFPDYTSPPFVEAVEATPVEYRSDEAIQLMREAAANKTCGEEFDEFCQLRFPGYSTTGVILYGGALVDPRSYSPLARILQQRYGFTVVVPVFDKDLAWDYRSCSTGRVELAKVEFPHVDRWTLVGHSFGAIAASLDLWNLYSADLGRNMTESGVGGMVFMAADARGDLGCGSLNFSESDIPFASLTGTHDQVLNFTRYNANRENLPPDTLFVEIDGGNHGLFSASDDSLRSSILNTAQDGHPTISWEVQQDVAAQAIANVAARAGWEPHWSSTPIHYNMIMLLLLLIQTKSIFGFL